MTAGLQTASIVRHISRSEHVQFRNLNYHVRRWGDPDAPPLVLLHGIQDTAGTFQFLVDALRHPWNIVAPDWRGHGHSDWTGRDYWSHDFIGDLDALLDIVFPGRPVDLVGHSMGGNIGGLYAALRPQRIRRFVSLDAFGPLINRVPVDPFHMLDDYLSPASGQSAGYATLDEVADRLMKANRRLSRDKALYLAQVSVSCDADGRFRWLFDPGVRPSRPTLHSLAEWGAVWARTTMPVMWIASGEMRANAPSFGTEAFAERHRLLPHAIVAQLVDTGHNLHHDRPADLADMLERFLKGQA